MKIWFDTEFIDNGWDGKYMDLHLLSLGMVREDGKTLYFENAAAPLEKSSEWVRENVIPHLDYTKLGDKSSKWLYPNEMRKHVLDFCGPYPEFWGYFCDWDWVLMLKTLFNTMLQGPGNWPQYALDVRQLIHMSAAPIPRPANPANMHNALADAIWTREYYNAAVETIREHGLLSEFANVNPH